MQPTPQQGGPGPMFTNSAPGPGPGPGSGPGPGPGQQAMFSNMPMGNLNFISY